MRLSDCLQASKPSRERFPEWREGGMGCAQATHETLRVIGTWNRMFKDHHDLLRESFGPVSA